MNGLFFAQTEKEPFQDEQNKDIIINNISFTKNSSLIIGFYNLNKYCLLQPWDLKPYHLFRDFNLNDKKEREGSQILEYYFSSDMFNILYENDFIIKSPIEIDNLENY